MKRQQASSASVTNATIFTSEDKIASIFQPDTLLSAQYFDNLRRKTQLEPEKRLMLAVLEDAITCYQENFVSRNGKKKRFFDEVKEWIVSPDGDWVFSFENVCEVLGLNAAYLRQGLLRWNPKFSVPPTDEPRRMVG
jgi:hypothetical protein